MQKKILLVKEIEDFKKVIEELKKKEIYVHGLDLDNKEETLNQINEFKNYETEFEENSEEVFNFVIKEFNFETLEKIFMLNDEKRDKDQFFWSLINKEVISKEILEEYEQDLEVFYFWFSKYKKQKKKNFEEKEVHEVLFEDVTEMVNDCKKTLYNLLDLKELTKKVDILRKMGKNLSLEEKMNLEEAEQIIAEYKENVKEQPLNRIKEIEDYKKEIENSEIQKKLNKEIEKEKQIFAEEVLNVLNSDFWENEDVGFLKAIIDYENKILESVLLEKKILLKVKKEINIVSKNKIELGYQKGCERLQKKFNAFEEKTNELMKRNRNFNIEVENNNIDNPYLN